jgi:hypothetical protein
MTAWTSSVVEFISKPYRRTSPPRRISMFGITRYPRYADASRP